MQAKDKKIHYRVKFQAKEDKSPMEVVVSSIADSDFLGLIKLAALFLMKVKNKLFYRVKVKREKDTEKLIAFIFPTIISLQLKNLTKKRLT